MPDSSPRPAPRLAAVPAPAAGPTIAPATAPARVEPVPSLFDALDAGDEDAVRAWVVAHVPEPTSLALYGLLFAAGVTGLVEWPAILLTGLAQVFVDQRLGGLEHAVAELRAVVEGRPRPA